MEFIIELAQKLGLMVVQFIILAVFAMGLGGAIKWCTTHPETTAKQIVLHIIAVGFIIGVIWAAIWMIKHGF